MNYEQKYKEALARAKKLKETCDSTAVIGWCECVFPELKGNEDRKIRNAIYDALKYLEREHSWDFLGDVDILDAYTWLEKQGEQKSVDKIEPKFKVGDFIANDYCRGKVVGLTNDAYLLDTEQGMPFSYEHNIHLWTIKDAKDGDVLAGKVDGNSYILIYKQIKDGWIETYGHYYYSVNRFCAPSQSFCRDVRADVKKAFRPATEKQRNLLFAKIKEAGYEWNADKKELKKL